MIYTKQIQYQHYLTIWCTDFVLQDRIDQLELDLSEERQGGDQLMDRIDRGREQVQHTLSHTQHILIISAHLCG